MREQEVSSNKYKEGEGLNNFQDQVKKQFNEIKKKAGYGQFKDYNNILEKGKRALASMRSS